MWSQGEIKGRMRRRRGNMSCCFVDHTCCASGLCDVTVTLRCQCHAIITSRVSLPNKITRRHRRRCRCPCRRRRSRSAVAVDHTRPPRHPRPQHPRPHGDLLPSEPTLPIATPPRSLTPSDVTSISGGPERGFAETYPYVSRCLCVSPPHTAAPLQPSHPTRSSTPASADSRTTSSGSSPPHTPLFPASSADFLPFYRGSITTRNSRSPSSAASLLNSDMCESSHLELARLRSAAFLELQRSVQENGEGFVKRMREFEDSRSKSAQHSRPRGVERRRRKRYSPSVPTSRSTGKPTVSDDDDDVLILSSTEPIYIRQKRSSSLGAMDDSDFQLHGETNASGRLSLVSSIFHPLPVARYALHGYSNNTNQSTELSTSFSTSFSFSNPFHTNAFQPASSHSSSDSLASSVDTSLSSSHTEDAKHPSSSPMVSPPRSLNHPPAGAILPSASSAEKALAAITLAMANGAGGLEDYEAVRALDVSSTDESHVGELWH